MNDTSHFVTIKSSETEEILEQYRNGEGFLSYPGEVAQSFIRSSKAEPDWPNLLIILQSVESIDDQEHRLIFHNILSRPKSKGSVTLDTNKYKAGIRDDVELALIDYKYLTHPDDIETLLEGATQYRNRVCLREYLEYRHYFRCEVYFPYH